MSVLSSGQPCPGITGGSRGEGFAVTGHRESAGAVDAAPAGEGLSQDTQGLYALDRDHGPRGAGPGWPSRWRRAQQESGEGAVMERGCPGLGSGLLHSVVVGSCPRSPG